MSFKVNLITPDTGEHFAIELSNGTLTNLPGFLADDPDLTLTINRTDLERAMVGIAPLQQQIADGTARLDGDIDVLAKLAELLVHFSPTFAIMPGTAGAPGESEPDPFVQEPLGDSTGG